MNVYLLEEYRKKLLNPEALDAWAEGSDLDVVFHGSKSDLQGNVFSFGSKNGALGDGIYTSTSIDEVNDFYTINHPDFESKVTNRYEEISAWLGHERETLEKILDSNTFREFGDFDLIFEEGVVEEFEINKDDETQELADKLDGQSGDEIFKKEFLMSYVQKEEFRATNDGVVYPLFIKRKNEVVLTRNEYNNPTYFELKYEYEDSNIDDCLDELRDLDIPEEIISLIENNYEEVAPRYGSFADISMRDLAYDILEEVEGFDENILEEYEDEMSDVYVEIQNIPSESSEIYVMLEAIVNEMDLGWAEGEEFKGAVLERVSDDRILAYNFLDAITVVADEVCIDEALEAGSSGTLFAVGVKAAGYETIKKFPTEFFRDRMYGKDLLSYTNFDGLDDITHYISLNPNNLKSAVANIGEFSLNSNSILEKRFFSPDTFYNNDKNGYDLSEYENNIVAIKKDLSLSGIASIKDGEIYINTNKVHNREQLEEVLAHEIIGHIGVDGILGENRDSFMLNAYEYYKNSDKNKMMLEKVRNEYNLDLSSREGRIKAASEMIAFEAENKMRSPVINKLKFKIKKFLNKIGLFSNENLKIEELIVSSYEKYKSEVDNDFKNLINKKAKNKNDIS